MNTMCKICDDGRTARGNSHTNHFQPPFPIPPTMSANVVKLSYGSDLRRVRLPDGTPSFFKALLDVINSMYPELAAGVNLHFHDDEGDVVLVASDAELAEAFRVSDALSRPCLKLSLSKAPSGTVAAPVPTPASVSVAVTTKSGVVVAWHSAILAEIEPAIASRFGTMLERDWLPGKYLKRIYWGHKDGMHAGAFHERCDKMGPTLTLLRTRGKDGRAFVFGGFTTASFTDEPRGNGDYAHYACTDAFLFSVVGPRTALAKYPIRPGLEEHVLYVSPGRGPCFGTMDLWVSLGHEEGDTEKRTVMCCNAQDPCGLAFVYPPEFARTLSADEEYHTANPEAFTTNDTRGACCPIATLLDIEVFQVLM